MSLRPNKKAAKGREKLDKGQEMSLGYAEKLSYREDVGSVGMPEIFDSPELLHKKVDFWPFFNFFPLNFVDTVLQCGKFLEN